MVALYILLPLIALITGGLTITAMYLGLKWNTQINIKNELPTIELPSIPNPFTNIQEQKQEKEMLNIMDEWLNGAKREV